MPNTSLVKDLAAYSWIINFALEYLMGTLIHVITWFSPGGSFRSTWQSASDLLNASYNEHLYDDLADGKNTALYLDGRRKAEAGREATDQDKQVELWAASLEMTGLKGEDTALHNWQ